MPDRWNPDRPDVLGPQWRPSFAVGSGVFNSPYRAAVLRSTTAETIEAARFAVDQPSANSLPLVALMEAFPAASMVTQPGVSTTDYAPTADDPGSDIGVSEWQTNSTTTVDLWARIDDPVVFPPSDGLFIRTNSTTPVAYMCEVGSTTFPLTARVHRLSIAAVIGAQPNGNNSQWRQFAFRLYHKPTSTFYTAQANQWTSFFGTILELNFGEINPVTLLPWTPADVRSFGAGGDWLLRVESVATATLLSTVHSMALRVHWTPNDPRAAVGTWQNTPGIIPAVVQSLDLYEPDGAGDWQAEWAKPSSGDFAFLFRRANAVAVTGTSAIASNLRWQFIGDESGPAGASPPPVAGMRSLQVPVNTFGQQAGAATESPNLMAKLDLVVSGGASLSVDSQPYRVAPLTQSGPFSVQEADPSTIVSQRMTPEANEDYLGVGLLTRPPVSGTLVVSVNRVSDGVQMGGTLEVTADQVRAEGQASPNAPGWYYVEGFLSAGASLVSGTQYEVRMDPSDGTWGFMATRQDDAIAIARGFGGSTGSFAVNGVAETQLDMGVFLFAQPDPPRQVRAEVYTRTLDDHACNCDVPGVNEVSVSWLSALTPLGANFARYEVERLTGAGGTWEPVAQVLREDMDPSIGTAGGFYTDRQTPRGIPVRYRVRNVRTDGAFSEWVDTEWVTADPFGCEVIITSNVDPDVTVVYTHEPTVPYDDLNNATDELVRIYGSYGHSSFSEPEDRGWRATLRLVVNFARQPTDLDGNPIGGTRVFDPLRAAVQAHRLGDVPYLCVLTSEGDIWRGRVRITDAQRDMPGWRYHADIEIVPSTATDGVITVE